MIRLQSIWDTEKGKNDYPQVKQALLERFGVENISQIPRKETFENIDKRGGYGTHTYTGQLKDGVELSEIELAIIIDNGYSFFGGSSNINPDKTFKVEIWFD